jgi:hypothetical protein
VAAGNFDAAVWQEYIKTRSTDGTTFATVQNNDELGRFNFLGDDGNSLIDSAYMKVKVDGAPSDEIVPSRFEFWTMNASGVRAERFTLKSSGNVGIGVTDPLSVLHLKAGTATANTAPLQFTSGTLETAPRAGVMEFLTDKFYGTITTGAARKTFAFLESPALVTPNIGVASGASLTLTGALVVDTATLVVDATNDRVGINTATPLSKLHVTGLANVATGALSSTTGAPTTVMNLFLETASDFAAGLNVLKRGTSGDATAALSSTAEIGYHSFYGWDGTTYARGAYALVKVSEAWTSTAHGTRYSVATTPVGATASNVGFTVTDRGNVLVNSSVTAQPTTGTMGLFFGDGTAPATMASNTAGLYANDVAGTVNMFAINEAGVITQLTGVGAALTQTYSTATTTHAAVTQLAAPAGGTGALEGAYDTAGNRDLMIASVNAAMVDIANIKQFVNEIVDQLQVRGILA